MRNKEIYEKENYLEIVLSCETSYKIDKEHRSMLELLDWYCGHYNYLQIKVNGRIQRFHKLITSCPEGMVVDHINRDPTDNRSCNLRVATKQKNVMNRANITGNYKGVSWSKSAKKWRATARLKGKSKHLGYFIKEKEAAKAYNDHVLEYFPEHGYLNKI